MQNYNEILQQYSNKIVNSIQNREYLGDIDYEIEKYTEMDHQSFLLKLIFIAPINDIKIIIDEKGPNDEDLKIQCNYDDPQSMIRMSLYYNAQNRYLEVCGTNLLLSNEASHAVKLINYIEEDHYDYLNEYVETELDTYSRLDFKRLFEEIGPIYVKNKIFE